jgi:hypothetical protein
MGYMEIARNLGHSRNVETYPTLGLIKVHVGEDVAAIRFAHVSADLAFASWEPVPAGVRTIVKPWTFVRRWRKCSLSSRAMMGPWPSRALPGEGPRDNQGKA